MKRIVFFLTCLSVGLAMRGNPVSPERAALVAKNLLSNQSKGLPVTRVTEGWTYSGIYLFEGVKQGFVLVSANDAACPVLGYSLDGTMPVGQMPLQLAELLDVYQAQIEWAAVHCSEPGGEIAALWHQFEIGQPPLAAKENVVEPLLTTRWNQAEPYNNLCPRGCVTGCAATSQAQMMKYWNYPPFGFGSYAYAHTTYGVQSADYGHTLYDWNHMPDTVTPSSAACEQQAIATLMYHVGVSLEMAYNTPLGGGSAAIGLVGEPGYRSIDNSLKDYFYYSPSMRVINKDQGFTDETWSETLKAELRQKRPIIYSGISDQGGHGFVCDGYDANGLFHFNFGWSGDGDGYYAIGAIVVPRGPNGEFGSYDFSSNNQALIGAMPLYALRLNDTVKAFTRQGGIDTVFLALNPQNSALLDIQYHADWLTVDTIDSMGVVVLTLEAEVNRSGLQREAFVTFTQGTESVILRVIQDCYDEEDYCPVTVVMSSRRSGGWPNNSHLTLESEGGMVYGKAALTASTLDSVTINVSPQKLYVVWHSGGGTDRYVGYTIKDAYGHIRASVENAFHDTTNFVIESPCHNLAVEQAPSPRFALYPNPTNNIVYIRWDTDEDFTLELLNEQGRTLLVTQSPTSLDLSHYPSGVYLVRIVSHSATYYSKVVRQ